MSSQHAAGPQLRTPAQCGDLSTSAAAPVSAAARDRAANHMSRSAIEAIFPARLRI